MYDNLSSNFFFFTIPVKFTGITSTVLFIEIFLHIESAQIRNFLRKYETWK